MWEGSWVPSQVMKKRTKKKQEGPRPRIHGLRLKKLPPCEKEQQSSAPSEEMLREEEFW